MKRAGKYLFILFLLGAFLMGCGEKEAPEFAEESKELGEDFRITVTSAQSWYTPGEFKKNCRFTLKLEYIGEKEEIQISHADPLGAIGIEHENGEIVLSFGGFVDVLTYETLKKGEPYEVTFDAEDLKFDLDLLKDVEDIDTFDNFDKTAFQNGTLKKGRYNAVGYVDFSVEKESGESEKYELVKLPLTFEIR